MWMLTSCIFAPVAERDEAKALLEKAELVDAMRWAKQEYMAAKELFATGLNFYEEKKKSRKNEKSKEFFIKSSQSAVQAYEKSLQEKIDEVKKEFEAVMAEISQEGLTMAYPEIYQDLEKELESTKKFPAQLPKNELEVVLAGLQQNLAKAKEYEQSTKKLRQDAEEVRDNIARLMVVCLDVKANISEPQLYKTYAANVKSMDKDFSKGSYQLVIEAGKVLWVELEQLAETAKKKRVDALKSYAEAKDILSSTKKKVDMSTPETEEEKSAQAVDKTGGKR